MEWLTNLIATPLGVLMRFCYNIVRNYGLTIILFTLCTKILLFPVQLLVQKNSIKMVKMEPRLHALKLKYIDDKDAYLDAQIALYKEEKYRPMAGTVPLLIQIPIIFGLIDVIYQPLTHILHLARPLVDAFCAEAEAIVGAPLGSSPQLKVVELITTGGMGERFLAAGGAEAQSAVSAITRMNLSFAGVNLALVPSIARPDILWAVPALAGLSAWLMCDCQNRINVLQVEQNRLSQIGMTVFMIAFSTFFAFIVPTGVGLYWIAGNLFAIPFMIILNLVMNPKKYIDYRQMEVIKRLNAEKEQLVKVNSKRAKADYKRFCAEKNQQSMRVMFYSEQSGFYKYFQNIIEALLKKSDDLILHYVTSDPNDAIFAQHDPRIVPYYIDEKRLIPLMMKVESDIVVMTVPDLEKYHIKRSKVRPDVEYIYTDHACTSLNLTYRAGALDHFDTVFAVSPSQERELRQIEALRHTKRKTVLECGYGLIDNMIAAYQRMEKQENAMPTILIAPSWQEDNILESCLDQLLDGLLGHGYRVIVRPHPQFVRRFPVEMERIVSTYRDRQGDDFSIELDFSSNVTIYTADLVITDWSAIGYEFMLTTDKPALFINTKMKVVNPDWDKIEEVPYELQTRNVLGRAVDPGDLDDVAAIVSDLFANRALYAARIREEKHNSLFNIGRSGEVGASYILSRLRQKRREN